MSLKRRSAHFSNRISTYGAVSSVGSRVGLAGWALVCTYIGAAALLGRTDIKPPRLCPFFLLTGRSCPLCGLSRAILLSSQGRVREAVRQYPTAIGMGIMGLGVTWSRLRAERRGA